MSAEDTPRDTGAAPDETGQRVETGQPGQAKPARSRADAPTRRRADARVEGVAADQATQSGEDARKRGWFWHWNSIVTQFAPLIGLKGVGLLNSYTVWTDRREDSPNRGYAFPSQQSEADFYGEDRAELITINKILVALDLIEIRKEMIVKPDAQGRKWRVPHNFYRVKDHGDGYTLTPDAVLAVVALADRDKNVFRHTRRIFSAKFAPIDGGNVWHGILPEVRRHPTWQKLAAKVEADERRASDRTRAGHAARRSGSAAPGDLVVPTGGDGPATGATRIDTTSDHTVTPAPAPTTIVAASNRGSERAGETSVAMANDGSGLDVAGVNRGSTTEGPTTVDAGNDGRPTVVAPANTTYDQSVITTTTTTTSDMDHESRDDLNRSETTPEPSPDLEEPITGHADAPSAEYPAFLTGPNALTIPNVLSSGPGEALAPADAPGELRAFQAFADANNRPISPAERHLLRNLAEQFAPFAEAAGEDGWSWLVRAIYEAVEAGSAFVAPRRIREILGRWSREGVGTSGSRMAVRGSDRRDAAPRTKRREEVVEDRRDERDARVIAPVDHRGDPSANRQPPTANRPIPEPPAGGSEPLVPMPFILPECGASSAQVWAAVLGEIAAGGVIARSDVETWLRPAQVIGRDAAGGLVLGVTSQIAQRRVATRYLGAVEAAVAAITGIAFPVTVAPLHDWLAAHPDRGLGEIPGSGEAATGG